MEKKVKKFGLRKMLAVLAVALACVCMWGCSDDKFQWEHFGGAEVVGFVNDSLVMVGDYQNWVESHEGVFEPYWDVTGVGHERLCVYNYRVQENGPRWCGQLDDKNTTNAFRGQMTDSIIWGGDMPNSIRLWKVGETQHLLKLKKIMEGCSSEFGIGSVKQWLDGTFIVRGNKSLNASGDSCQYAVLDTIENVLTYKRLDKNLEWIKECDDVRTWNKDVYCFMPGEHSFEAVLLRNKRDTIEIPIEFTVGTFFGNVLKPNGHLCALTNGEVVCSGIVWRGGLTFLKDEKVVVELK